MLFPCCPNKNNAAKDVSEEESIETHEQKHRNIRKTLCVADSILQVLHCPKSDRGERLFSSFPL